MAYILLVHYILSAVLILCVGITYIKGKYFIITNQVTFQNVNVDILTCLFMVGLGLLLCVLYSNIFKYLLVVWWYIIYNRIMYLYV